VTSRPPASGESLNYKLLTRAKIYLLGLCRNQVRLWLTPRRTSSHLQIEYSQSLNQ